MIPSRRDFLLSSLALAAGATVRADTPPKWRETLRDHRLANLEHLQLQMRWPRLVGKNARLDVHGRGPRVNAVRITTDAGASGWGTLRGNPNDLPTLLEQVKGKPLTDLFDPAVGVTETVAIPLDFALHDLAGKILGIPVYEMLGNAGAESFPCYSGMIYFDDLEPPEEPAGVGKVLENARWDVEYGYRQLKVKIGRGNRWMPAEDGLKRDIEVTLAINKELPDVEILVDANDGYTVEGMLRYLEGIGNINLFWIEEPFRESVEGFGKLREWLKEHERSTLLADGEASPDWEVLTELSETKLLDVQLVDIVGHGFTAWRKLMPQLKEWGVQASPHAWGDVLKTYYTSHIARGLGNVVTIEGVTCECDGVDFGKYELNEGRLSPSPEPGFGMRLVE